MCGDCYDEGGCWGGHRHSGHHGARLRYFEEPAPESRRERLEEEKRILERRLKDLEARLAETSN